MSTFKATNKRKTKDNDVFKATSQRSYDSALVGRWESGAKASFEALKKYSAKIGNNEYLSKKDLEDYKSAMDSYVDNSNRLRKINSSFGKGYSEDEEKQWADYISTLQTDYNQLSKHYSKFKNELEYNDAVKIGELYALPSTEIEQKMGVVVGETKAQIESLQSEYNRISKNLQQHNRGNTKYSSTEKLNAARKRKESLGKQISKLQELIDGGGIAYTTSGGQNITWSSLYKKKKNEEDFNALYSELSANPDWAEQSKYKPTYDTSETFGIYNSDFDYEAANRPIIVSASASNDKYYATQTTEQEKELFNYLAHTKGTDYAIDWLMSREDVYKERLRNQGIENARKLAKELPVLSDVLAVASSIVTPFEYLGNVVTGNAADRVASADFSSTIYSTRMEQIDWEIGGWDAFDFLYSTGTSLAESVLATATFGKLGGATLGMNAAAHGTNDALNRGMSKGQAFTSGLASGIFEGVFETWSIGAFGDLTKNLKRADFRNLAKYIGKNMWNNAKEETLTEIANMAYDYLANGDFSQYETAIRQYMASGMSEADAKLQVAKELGVQVAEAAGSGALMGFGFGVGGGVNARHNIAQSGRVIKDAGQVRNLVDLGKSLGEGTNAYEYADKITDKSRGFAIGNLLGAVAEGIPNANKADMIKAFEEKGYNTKEANLLVNKMFEQGLNSVSNIQGMHSPAQDYNDVLNDPNSTVSQRNEAYEGILRGVAENRFQKAMGKAVKNKSAIATYKASAEEQGEILTQEENPIESKFESNLEGKDFNSANDKIIASKKLVSSEKDNMKFEVVYDDGTTDTVDANNINFGNEGESLVYSYVMDMNIPVGIAESLVGLYKGNDSNSAAEYISGMREAFVLGKYNQEADLNNGQYASKLTDEQRSNAFKLGQIYAKEKAASDDKAIKGETKSTNIKKQEGKVHFEGDKLSLKSVQDVSVKSLEVLTEALGKDIHIYESYEDKNGNRMYKDANGNIKKAPNGFYNQADGSIWIDLNAGKKGEGMMMYTVAHELTHFIKQWSPTKFKVLADFLVEQYGKKGVSVASLVREQQAKAKRNNRELSYDEAFEEMVADSMESMLVDGEVIRKLAQKDKGLFNKIKAWIDNLLNRLKEVYKGYSPDSKEGNMVLEMQKSFKQIQELFADALVDASDNFANNEQKNTTSKGDVKMSVREIIGEDGTNYGVGVYLDSELLTKLTESQRKDKIKEFVINELSGGHFIAYDNNNDAVDIKIAHKHDNFKNQSGKPHKVLKELYHKHNDLVIKQEAVVLIDELIANAKYDSSASSTYSHGWLDNNGKNDWDYWKVFIQEKNKTVWEATLNIANTANGEKILYDIDPIKKVEEAIKSASNTTNNIIHQTNGKSQEKLSDRDTLGNTLTEAQQTYFAESKVRDDNGNLKVMYHGTPNATFTKFRSGTYFTEHKWYADNYQNQGASSLSYKKTADNPDTYSVYLDIKKPFDTRNKKERDIFYKEYYQQWGTGTDLMESGLPDWLDGQDLQEFLEEQGYDYDGLILDEGATGGYGEEVTSRGLSYVVFNPEQVKSVDNKTPTDNPDYRFSMRENVEETKDLVAVHNLSEEKLLKSLQLGGLPMPSIAIIKAKEGHNTFGNISLVFNKETIDPQFMRANKVYSGDAWTPTYPRVEHKVNDKAQKKIANRINNLVPEEVLRGLGGLHIDSYNLEQDLNRHNGNLVEMFRYNTALKYVFLTENGVQLELPNKFKPLGRYSNRDNDAIIRVAENVSEEKLRGITGGYTNEQIYEVEPEIRKAVNGYLQEKYKKLPEKALAKLISEDKMSIGQMFDLAIDALNYLTDGIKQEVDYYAARDLIDKTIDAQKYESWIKEVFANIVEKEGIRNNKDMFTPSGNRRSFEALHYEHNLENVIKAMKEDGTKGIGSFGRGNIFGASTTEYGSIAEIKEDAQNRMKQIPEEKYEEIRKGFSERFFELAYSLPIHKDSFTATDSASTMLVEAVAKFKTKSGMANYLRNESKGWANYSDYVVDDLIQLVSEIRQMPVGYFEAKPQRAVGFDEVATAIIPDSASAELKQKLTDYGIKFVEYESKNEESRLEALNSLEDVKFSDRDSEGNELSKEQQEFFKDSKVRDENGNLVTLYHGTDNGGFTVFDASKSDDKTSLFLTASKEMAQTYAISSKEIQLDGTSGQSGIYSVYANIINPYVVDAKGKNWDNIRTGLNPFLQSTRDIAQKAKKKGYDGVIIKNLVDAGGYSFMSGEKVAPSTVVIAFNSNQIKSISNTTPTTNPDIRYSERDYSYDSLVSKPDMAITSVNDKATYKPTSTIRKSIVEKAIKNASSFGKLNENGNVAIHVNDIDTDVILSKNSLAHGLDRRLEVSAPVILNVGSILKNSIRINELTPKKQSAIGSYVLIGYAESRDYAYPVRMVVNQYTNEVDTIDVLYAVNTKKETVGKMPGSHNNVALPTVSTISISNLLDYVNKYFPDVLPENVWKHYGHTARPEGDLGKSALYSDRDDASVSTRSLLANALEGAAQNDIEKNKLAQYKEKIALIESEQKKLHELREKLFTKGINGAERREIQEEATRTANRINTYDRQLFNLESTTALKNVLTREKELARKRQKQKDAENLKAYKEKVAETTRELLKKNRESREKAIEGRTKTEMRHKVKKVVNDLNNLLLKPTKERHVPEELRIAVAEALAIVNMDTVDADARVAKYNELIAKAKDPDIIASLTETRDRILNQGNKLGEKLTKLKDAYAMINASADGNLKSLYDDVIYSKIEKVQKDVGKTPLRNMTLKQLEDVYELYKMVLTTVRDSNKAFAEDLKMTRQALGSNTFAEIKESNKAKDRIRFEGVKNFGWMYLKPMLAIKKIGSATLQKLWNNILYGQEVFAQDYDEAVKFAKEIKEKYGYSDWDLHKLYSFESKSGKVMKINLEQMMSIYAYSKRKQADEHIEFGGILLNESIIKVKNKLGKTVEYKVNDSTAYRLDKMQVGEIIATLEKEAPGAKDFVDEMQKYLSETMGEKGNEVSMKMYGIKLFKEEHYFPLKSSKDFMEAANAKLKGDVKIKNKGMTKATVEHANNPIVLENFLDVWGNHINEMAMYHGLVLPLEDFSRTLNYGFKADDKLNTDAESVKTALRSAFGESADNYLNELLKAINGGVLHDSSDGIANKKISTFKKSKVMASLSVIVQQPTAIIRAMGKIEPKYFVAQNFHHKRTWEELKKYCPTAIIKETGSFDTNMGRTIVDMIKEDRKFTEKVGDTLGKAPAWMDEMGWNMIWRALKKKVATEQGLSGEELLKECGKQMTLIINETQVYDSVMSRNELMRSKGALTKMATAFMGEPTTVANMIYGAALDIKRGNKKMAGKTIAAVLSSVVINGLVSSLVYALRDDDEDETFLEKYLESATTEVIDGFNIFTYIPYVKDAYSLLQGYDVERTDMALMGDVAEAIDEFFNVFDPEAYEGMSRSEIAKHIYESSVPLLTSICDMFGLPVGNILRDAKAIIVNDSLSMSKTSGEGIGLAIKDGWLNSSPKFVQNFVDDKKYHKLYLIANNGDTKYVKNEVAQMVAKKFDTYRNEEEDEEKAEKKAKQSVKSSFTAVYRDEYKKAYKNKDAKEMNRIRKFLYATGLWDYLSELDDLLAKWREEA